MAIGEIGMAYVFFQYTIMKRKMSKNAQNITLDHSSNPNSNLATNLSPIPLEYFPENY